MRYLHMKNNTRKTFLIFLAAMVVMLPAVCTRTAAAQESTPAAETETAEVNNGNGSEVLCLPDAYLTDPGSCNPLGPSEYLTEYVQNGGVYPEPPFTGKKLDPELSEVREQHQPGRDDLIRCDPLCFLYGYRRHRIRPLRPLQRT